MPRQGRDLYILRVINVMQMKNWSNWIVSILTLSLLQVGAATGADFIIEKALWNGERSVLYVEAKASKGDSLTIVNASDDNQVLVSHSILRKETLKARLKSPTPLPCRIRVVNETTGLTLEQDVLDSLTKSQPVGCSTTGGSEPPPPTEPPTYDSAAEAHASITVYEGPSTCVACHENEAIEMHGSVHYQQSGDAINLTNDITPFSANGLQRAGERGDGAIGINTYCGAHENSPRFTCAGCHVGNGRFPSAELPTPEPDRLAELSNIDCLMCHQETYKRFPTGQFEPLEIVAIGADGNPDPSLPPIVRTESMGIPIIDPVTQDFLFEPADSNSTLVKLGGSPLMGDRVTAAQTVHATTRKACLNCHAKAGGGDGTKRGDMSSALIDPEPHIDIHMSSNGQNLVCADCHSVGNHRMRGRGLDLRPNDTPEQFNCESCHDQPPHEDSTLNSHTERVACQTCHIPTYGKGVPTEVNRDWEDPHYSAAACNGRGGWLPREDKASDLIPSYQWFDGTSQVYVLGEDLSNYPATTLDDGSQAITLGVPNGSVNGTGSKIYPMKEHTSKSAVHLASNTLIAHSTFEFFRTGSFSAAVESALQQTERDGDRYEVAQVHTFQTINHGVEGSDAALDCGSCHDSLSGGPLRMDLQQDLGYELKSQTDTYQGLPVCTQCHGSEDSLSFSRVHTEHVIAENIACQTCHNFSRPERGLNTQVPIKD